MNFTGKIIHELNNKILIGREKAITILDNKYEIIDLLILEILDMIYSTWKLLNIIILKNLWSKG